MRSANFWSATVLFVAASLLGCGGQATPPSAPVAADTATTPPPADPAASTGLIPALEPQSAAPMSTSPEAAASKDAASTSQPAAEVVADTLAADVSPASPPVNRRAWLEELVASRDADLPHKSNLKKIGLALHEFHDALNHFPAINSKGEEKSEKGLSWRVHLLPYLGEDDLYNEFHFNEPWSSEHNKTLIERMPKVFGSSKEGKTTYQVFTGRNMPFQLGKGIRIRDFTDGTSNTIAVIMSGDDKADIWTKPGGLPFDSRKPAAVLGNVKDTTLALWADGRVSPVSLTSPSLGAMIQHQDGAVIPESELIKNTTTDEDTFQIATAPPLAAPAARINASHLPADALLAVVIQPRRFAEHPLIQKIVEAANWTNKSREEFILGAAPANMRPEFDKFGVNPFLVEEIRLVIGSQILQFNPLQPQNPPAILANFRLAIPYNEKAMVRDFLQNGQTPEIREVGGFSYLFRKETGLAYLPISDREFTIGQEEVLKSAYDPATTAKADSPLVKRLASAGNRMAVVAGVVTPAVREQMQMLAQQAPPQAALFMPYLTQLAGLAVAIDLNAPELFKLQAQFAKPELAEGLAGMLNAQLSASKAQFEQMKPLLLQGENAAAAPLLTELVGGLQLTAEGDTVIYTAARPNNLDDLPAALAPAFKQARAAAQQTEERKKLKQIALAMHNFHDVYNHFPAIDGIGDPKTKTGLSWRVQLLPFLGQAQLYNQFKQNEPWDSDHNKALIAKMPAIYGNNAEFKTRLHVLTGTGVPFQMGKGTPLREFTDGTSNTILVVEANEDTADIWTKPTALQFNVEDGLKCLGTFADDQTSFHAILADGSVRTISKLIDPDAFRKLVLHTDGEPVGNF